MDNLELLPSESVQFPYMRGLLLPIICALVSVGPSPAAQPATAPAPSTQPDIQRGCADLLAKWRDRFDHEKLNFIISPPFVLASDTGTDRIRQYLHGTITPAAAAMHKQFFKTRLNHPILILLFESDEPYRRLARQWFGDTDTMMHTSGSITPRLATC